MYIRTYFGICAVPGHSENVYAYICFLFVWSLFYIWLDHMYFDLKGAGVICTIWRVRGQTELYIAYIAFAFLRSEFQFSIFLCASLLLAGNNWYNITSKKYQFWWLPKNEFLSPTKNGKKMCRLNYESAISQVRKGWIKGTAQWVASCLLNCIVLCKAKK